MKMLSKLGIRAKILIFISVFLIIFFIIEATILYQVFLNGFKEVEKQNMIVGIQRVEGLINNEINNYSTKLSDWSNWDDTYNFIVDKNQAYIDSNLLSTSLNNLRLNFMIFIASSGAIIEERGISLETGKDAPIPKDLHELLSNSNTITTHKTLESNSQGILRLSDGFIIFASRPILTSEAKGPIRGTLIFARFIDKNFLKKIADLERSKIEIRDYYSNSLPKDFLDAKNLMATQGVKYIEPNGDVDTYFVDKGGSTTIDGFTFIYDFNKKPAFIIESELERPFYILGNKIITFALILFAVISLASVIFALLMLNRLVISKITKLNKDVSLINNPNSSTQKIVVKGNDEFASLALNINKMIDGLLSSQVGLKQSGDELIKEKTELAEKLKDLERMNNVMVDRELKMIELKKEIAILKTQSDLSGENKDGSSRT